MTTLLTLPRSKKLETKDKKGELYETERFWNRVFSTGDN